jgi:probable lipoprotein NlpC
MEGVTSANDMNRVYLNNYFLNFQMKLFFRLKSSQKLLFPATLVATLFLVSCASHRAAKVREEKVDTVIAKARSFMGTPYLYGGTTRSGMDCSGLLINSFRAVNITLPRTSEAQSKFGKEVKSKELQPGDLLFFATGKKKREITHVGLVVDVGRRDKVKFIHASTSLGVVETNLDTDYYKTRFRKARRVIK